MSCSESKEGSIKLIYNKDIKIQISDTTDSKPNKLFYYYDEKGETEYLVNLNNDFNTYSIDMCL